MLFLLDFAMIIMIFFVWFGFFSLWKLACCLLYPSEHPYLEKAFLKITHL